MNKFNLTPDEVHKTKRFLEFFSSIPDEKWCAGQTRMMTEKGMQHCAAGHLLDNSIHKNDFKSAMEEAQSLNTLLNKVVPREEEQSVTYRTRAITNINDREYSLGDTPKERIINALKSLLK